MDDDQDDYVGQLREVFERCDTDGTGSLNREGLVELCKELQLEDQSDQLIGELLGDDTNGLVDFDSFKEAFVMILSTAVDFDDLDGMGGISDIDEDRSAISSVNITVSDADILDEVSPKYVKGNRKYGRRSKPDIDLDDTAEISDVETDISSYAGPPPGNLSHRSDVKEVKPPIFKRNSVSFADDFSQGSLDGLDLGNETDPDEPPLSPEREDGEGTSILETFEAEGLKVPSPHLKAPSPYWNQGQNNASISQYAGTPTQDQSQVVAIQAIWEELGFQTDGFLDIDGLKIVCEHIGMEDMDNEELNNLFAKLDENQDGQVSFDEFLQGLFSHTASATPTPIPIGMSPAQRANLRRIAGSSMDDPFVRTATPSLLTINNNKLFTMLDPDNTGFARPEDVAEQLEIEGIEHPSEIMEMLDINMEAGKVNLQDISMRLDNILLAKGDDDGVYQVALATVQGELKYLRSQLDIVTDERDHLKDDIAEANTRNTKLAQEVDDRHNDIQRSNERQLKEIEDTYKQQIASLTAEIEKERDNLTTEEAGVRERLEKEIDHLKADEYNNKEKHLALQKENTRLEEELVEATERLIENEKTIQKQQRDLEGFQELEERLADLESNRESVSKQQEEYFESNIKEYQEKIKLMQDQVDELTQENDLLKNQGTERKLRRRTSKMHSNKPGRIGSVLSDYVNKPNVLKRIDSSSGTLSDGTSDDVFASSENESELEELDPISSRRSLPARSGGDGTSNEEEERKKLEEEKAKWEAEMEQIKEEHQNQLDEAKKDLEEARIMFEHECKDIEEKYKIEISGLEEEMEVKKEESELEIEKLRDDFANEQTKLTDEIERKFNAERTETKEKYERERQSREEEFAREKVNLRDKLEAEYNHDLDNKITEVKQQLLAEKADIENLLSKEKSDVEKDLLKAKNEAEMRLKERELDFIKEKGQLESGFGKEKSELLQKYNSKVQELEQILVNGEAGLKGQLRQDFNELLDKHKEEMEDSFSKEREELVESHEREKEEMNNAFEQERTELLQGHDSERSDLVERLQREKVEIISRTKKDKLEAFEKHRREKAELTEKFKKEKDALNEKHKKEKSEWEQKLQKERERFKKEREDKEDKYQRELQTLELNLSVDKDNLESTIRLEAEDRIRQDLKKELEEDYIEQIQRLRNNFEDEKSEFIVEKEEMEDRVRAAYSITESLSKRKYMDEDTQTDGVETVENSTDTTIDKEVDEEEMENIGAIDKMTKFVSGLFGDGPKTKGVQTEIKPLTERISQTEINAKYFQEKYFLEQKLKDTEALSDEMAKTIHQMTYTDKQWEEARRRQRIDEGIQTDTIEKANQGSLTDTKKVQMVNQEIATDNEVVNLDIRNEFVVRHVKVVEEGSPVIFMEKDTDDKYKDDKVKDDKDVLDKKPTEPSRDLFAETFAKTHLAMKRSPSPRRKKLTNNNDNIEEPIAVAEDPKGLENTPSPVPNRKDSSTGTELVSVPVQVQTSVDLLDSEVALAKRMEQEWMEEKRRLQNELREAQAFMFQTSNMKREKVDTKDEQTMTAIDMEDMNVGFHKDHDIGPKADKNEMDDLRLQVNQLEVDKSVLEEKLRASKALSEVMAVSMQSMAKPEVAGHSDKKVKSEGVRHGDTMAKPEVAGHSDRNRMAESESARHSDIIVKPEDAGLSYTMAEPGFIGQSDTTSEDEYQPQSAENYYLRLIENDEGGLETVRIPTGRVGGYTSKERLQQEWRVVSEEMKGLLYDVGYNESSFESDIQSNEDTTREEVEEEEVLQIRTRPELFQMPHMSMAPQIEQGVQADAIKSKKLVMGVQTDVSEEQSEQEEIIVKYENAIEELNQSIARKKEEVKNDFEQVRAEFKAEREQLLKDIEAEKDDEFKHNHYIPDYSSQNEQELTIVKYENAIIDLNESIARKKEEVKNEFERVRVEFKAEQARVIKKIKDECEAEKAEVEKEFQHKKMKLEMEKLQLQKQLETSPDGFLIQKEETGLVNERMEFTEDEHGNLQASRVKSDKAQDKVRLEELVQSLESIHFTDTYDDSWEHIEEDDFQSQIQEDTLTQREIQLTESQMPNMASAFQQTQAVQVDIMMWKPPSDFKSKLAQTESVKRFVKEVQTLQAQSKHASVQTVEKDRNTRAIQTDKAKNKEIGVQLETLKTKDQSSQYEHAQKIVGMQTIPSDVNHVALQTVHTEVRDVSVQLEALKSKDQSSQWEHATRIFGIQTIPSDVSHVQIQTEHKEYKDKELQTGQFELVDGSSQWDLRQEEVGSQTLLKDVSQMGIQTQNVEHKDKALQSEQIRLADCNKSTQTDQKAEVAREEAIQMTSLQQVYAAQQDNSIDKHQADQEERTLTVVSSLDDSSGTTEGPDEILGPRRSASETTEGPDEILGPGRRSLPESAFTVTTESSDGEVMGMLRNAPLISSFLSEKRVRPKKERRKKREKVRKLPDVPPRSSSLDGKSPPSDTTSGDDVTEKRPRSMSSGRQLPTPPGSDASPLSKKRQQDIKEQNVVPQRTHGELNSNDSLFARFFPKRQPMITGAGHDPDKVQPVQNNSKMSESAVESGPPVRPSSLGPLPNKTDEDSSDTRVMSPLTEKVTAQNNKLTQMLNLFRPDVKLDNPKTTTDPKVPRRSLSMPEEDLLHKNVASSLQSQRSQGDSPSPEFELHPSSSLFRQKPSDGQDADVLDRPSSDRHRGRGSSDSGSGTRTVSHQSRLKPDAQDGTSSLHDATDKNRTTGVGGSGVTGAKGRLQERITGLKNERSAEFGKEEGIPLADYDEFVTQQATLAESIRRIEQRYQDGGRHMTNQARIEMLEENCDRLKHELSENGKKLLEAEMQISIMEAQHMREIQRLKDKQGRESNKEVDKLKKDLVDKDHALHDLEKSLSIKAEQLGNAANRSKDELNQEVKDLREKKGEFEKKYRNTQRLLDEYMRKLKEQLTRSTRSDVLVKELYVENSKLQKALQVTEERQKIAERNCHSLREKNHAYLHVLRRVTPAAM